MGNFNRDRNSGGRRFGGGDRRDDRGERGGGGRFDRDRGSVQMHPATCSNCGNACEVPFKPTGAKPVLCSNCFRAAGGPDRSRDERSGGDNRRFDRPRFDDRRQDRPAQAPAPQYKEQLESLNYKLDKILNILKAALEPEAPKKTKEEMVSATTEMPVEKKTAPRKKKEKPVIAESAAEEPTV